MTQEIYIVLSEGKHRLIIEGPLHLYNRFLASLDKPQVKARQDDLQINQDSPLCNHIQPR
jgi:hypothetical protein